MRVQEFKVTVDGDGELECEQINELVADALENWGYTVDVVEITDDDPETCEHGDYFRHEGRKKCSYCGTDLGVA